jgi:hypothetical protein
MTRSSNKYLGASSPDHRRTTTLQALFVVLYLGCATLLVLKVPCTLHFRRESGLVMRDDGYQWLWDIGADTVALTTVFLEELALLFVAGAFAVACRMLNTRARTTEAEVWASDDDADPKLLVWVPFYEGEPWNALATPVGSPLASIDTMTQPRFGMHFESRLNRLLLANIDEGRDTLTGSAEHSPNLYTIGTYEHPSAWATLIIQCDQFQICMNHVDWDLGRYEVRHASELPSLGEVIEQL